MMANEKKDFDDFGLDDICEKPKVKENPKPELKPKEQKESLTITIPNSDGTFKSRDMYACTSEEFTEWLMFVYPIVGDKLDPTTFSSSYSRTAKLKEVVMFHKLQIFSNKKPMKDEAIG